MGTTRPGQICPYLWAAYLAAGPQHVRGGALAARSIARSCASTSSTPRRSAAPYVTPNPADRDKRDVEHSTGRDRGSVVEQRRTGEYIEFDVTAAARDGGTVSVLLTDRGANSAVFAPRKPVHARRRSWRSRSPIDPQPGARCPRAARRNSVPTPPGAFLRAHGRGSPQAPPDPAGTGCSERGRRRRRYVDRGSCEEFVTVLGRPRRREECNLLVRCRY
jgi:hypothetical protein